MNKTKTLTKSQIALALTLIALRPAFAADMPHSAATTSAKAEAEHAEAKADDYKASLDQINASIDAIEERIDDAPDATEQTAAKTRLETLKERRSELRKNYVKAKADELSADLKVEYAKVAAWTKRTYRDVKEKLTGDDDHSNDVVPATRAAVNGKANAAMADIALYKMHPSPENKADVKAALQSLEDEIDRLEDRSEELPAGAKRTAMEKRIDALEDRQDELENDFTKARWDNLVADLRSSWNSLFE